MSASLSSSLDALFSKMDGFISTKTVVGEPTNIGGVIIVPLIEAAFGVGAGANDKAEDDKSKKESSGGAMGAKITPSAVLVIMDNTVQLVNVKNQDGVNKLIDLIPGVLSKLGLDKLFNKKKDDAAE